MIWGHSPLGLSPFHMKCGVDIWVQVVETHAVLVSKFLRRTYGLCNGQAQRFEAQLDLGLGVTGAPSVSVALPGLPWGWLILGSCSPRVAEEALAAPGFCRPLMAPGKEAASSFLLVPALPALPPRLLCTETQAREDQQADPVSLPPPRCWPNTSSLYT